MRFRSTRAAIISAMVVAVQGTPAAAQTTELVGARELFQGDRRPVGGPTAATTAGPEAAATGITGIRYWLELEGIGAVAETRTFVTAQRFQLNVQSNADGFLAVWAFSASGHAELLLPTGGDPSALAIKAGISHISPPIRLRPPARDERLILVFARRQTDLPSLDVVEDGGALAKLANAGARDVLTETEERSEGAVGTYVVNRRGGPVIREIRVRHVAP